MADPTNYEQFNERVSELVQVVRDALKAAYGLESISQGQVLGLLAGIDDLASAPVGDVQALRDAINFDEASLVEMRKYGLGAMETDDLELSSWDDFNTLATGQYSTRGLVTTEGVKPPSDSPSGVVDVKRWFNSPDSDAIFEFQSVVDDTVYRRRYRQNAWATGWIAQLSEANTTVDSNGFVKQASPIFRLANLSSTSQGSGFHEAGAGMANAEAQGVTAEHVGTGVYEVSGSLGLAADGWQIELPQEPGTGQHMIMAQTSWDASTEVLTVRTFNRQFDTNTASIVPGDPADIPDGRWLDLRLEMPEPETPEEETTP